MGQLRRRTLRSAQKTLEDNQRVRWGVLVILIDIAVTGPTGDAAITMWPGRDIIDKILQRKGECRSLITRQHVKAHLDHRAAAASGDGIGGGQGPNPHDPGLWTVTALEVPRL